MLVMTLSCNGVKTQYGSNGSCSDYYGEGGVHESSCGFAYKDYYEFKWTDHRCYMKLTSGSTIVTQSCQTVNDKTVMCADSSFYKKDVQNSSYCKKDNLLFYVTPDGMFYPILVDDNFNKNGI